MGLSDLYDKLARLAQTNRVCLKSVRTGDVLLKEGEFYKVLRVMRKSNRVDVIDQRGYQQIYNLSEFEGRWSKDQAQSLPIRWPA